MARGGFRPGGGRKPKPKAPETTAIAPRPRGRPTKYEAAFCEEVEARLAEGLSIEACAGAIGVSRPTIYEWMEHHSEFSDAVKRGQAGSVLWWETQLREIALKGGGPGRATAVIFGLKNRAPDSWREKSTQELVGKDEGPIQTEAKPDLSELTQDERNAFRAILERRAAGSSEGPAGA